MSAHKLKVIITRALRDGSVLARLCIDPGEQLYFIGCADQRQTRIVALERRVAAIEKLLKRK